VPARLSAATAGKTHAAAGLKGGTEKARLARGPDGWQISGGIRENPSLPEGAGQAVTLADVDAFQIRCPKTQFRPQSIGYPKSAVFGNSDATGGAPDFERMCTTFVGPNTRPAAAVPAGNVGVGKIASRHGRPHGLTSTLSQATSTKWLHHAHRWSR